MGRPGDSEVGAEGGLRASGGVADADARDGGRRLFIEPVERSGAFRAREHAVDRGGAPWPAINKLRDPVISTRSIFRNAFIGYWRVSWDGQPLRHEAKRQYPEPQPSCLREFEHR